MRQMFFSRQLIKAERPHGQRIIVDNRGGTHIGNNDKCLRKAFSCVLTGLLPQENVKAFYAAAKRFPRMVRRERLYSPIFKI